VNIDEGKELIEKYNIMSVPTILFIKDQEMIDFLPGFTSKELIKEKINKLI
jgi:thioredoxin 1